MRSASLIAGAIACAVALVVLAGCGARSTPPSTPAAHVAPVLRPVVIRKVAFQPAVVEAAPGDTIAWSNQDLVPHTVTARDGRFNSGNLAPDSTWRWIVAGTDSAAYFCSYHTTMHGVVRLIRR